MEKNKCFQLALLFPTCSNNLSSSVSNVSFNKGANAIKTSQNICIIYRKNAIKGSVTRKQFNYIFLKRPLWSELLLTFRKIIWLWQRSFEHNHSNRSTINLANIMNCDQSTILWYLHSVTKVQKLGLYQQL